MIVHVVEIVEHDEEAAVRVAATQAGEGGEQIDDALAGGEDPVEDIGWRACAAGAR